MRYICGYIKSIALVGVLTFLVVVESLGAQETIDQLFGDDLVADGLYFDGETSFDEETGALTFLTSGLIQNPKLKARYAQYEKNADLPLDSWYNVFIVPARVKRIIIGEDVTITGRFVIDHDCVVEGKNRKKSVIYGTSQTRYSHNRGEEYGENWDAPWKYSSIDVVGSATVYVKNLTVLNPYGYCISGYAKGAVLHCQSVDMIDSRGGDQNNSDGFIGQAGSSLTDVYIETADDAVKAYHDLTMTNVEIVMLKNGAPVQFGWNADDNEDSKVVVCGLVVRTRDGVDRYNRGVFSWVSEDNTKVVCVTVNDVVIDAPNAYLFEMNPSVGTANIAITNASIKTKGEGVNKTKGAVTVSARLPLKGTCDD
ncbi:MAG: hypothetical protein IJL92_09250 [Thermoguttaceae bacterium]|nr:hypothetical protein [Thermoguttaceae bacterium]